MISNDIRKIHSLVLSTCPACMHIRVPGARARASPAINFVWLRRLRPDSFDDNPTVLRVVVIYSSGAWRTAETKNCTSKGQVKVWPMRAIVIFRRMRRECLGRMYGARDAHKLTKSCLRGVLAYTCQSSQGAELNATSALQVPCVPVWTPLFASSPGRQRCDIGIELLRF